MTKVWFKHLTRLAQCSTRLQKFTNQLRLEITVVSEHDGPTERLSTFVDNLLQMIAKEQESYLKDSKNFT